MMMLDIERLTLSSVGHDGRGHDRQVVTTVTAVIVGVVIVVAVVIATTVHVIHHATIAHPVAMATATVRVVLI